jgi:hexokinase
MRLEIAHSCGKAPKPVFTVQPHKLMNDEELHRLLRQHPAKLTLPTAFEREVWSRIEADEERSMTSLLAELARRLLTSLARPAVALAIIALFGAAGAGMGVVMIKTAERKSGELAYLETINPLVRAHPEVQP